MLSLEVQVGDGHLGFLVSLDSFPHCEGILIDIVSAITCFAVYLVLLFCLPETLRSIVGNGAVYADSSWIVRPKWRQERVVDPAKFPRPPPPTLLSLLKLLQYPPILIVSLNNALLFAAYYGINVTLPTFLEGKYGFTTTEVGIAYLAPGKQST